MAKVKAYKILIVSQYFWPEDFRINDLAIWFCKKGYSVKVLTARPNYPKGRLFCEFKKSPKSFARYGPVEIHRVPALTRGSSKLALMLNYLSFLLLSIGWVLVYGRKSDLDGVFIFAPSPITSAIPGIILSKITGCPAFLWVLDLWPETLSALGVVKNKLIINTLGFVVKNIYGSCSIVFAQSREAMELISKKVDPNRNVEIDLLHSWAENIESSIEQQKLFSGLSAFDFNVTFAGNLGSAQGLGVVLNAAQILKSSRRIRLIFAGDGSQLKNLKLEVARLGLEEKVLFLGRIPASQMTYLYRRSQVLLITLSSNEVFDATIPAKLQSYLAAGKPVVAALKGAAARVIVESKAGKVGSPLDYVALSENILYFSNLSDSELTKIGVNASVYYQKNFAFENSMKRLEKRVLEKIG